MLGQTAFRTPFADEVLRLGRTEQAAVSFHSLPWSQGRSIDDAGEIADKYRLLFGAAFLDSELSYSAGVLDSYFEPSASLDLAQQLAADAFGADRTFFVTCGTSIANRVAFDSLAGADARILVDRTAHQSIHVAADRSSASVDYAPTAEHVNVADQPLLDTPRLLQMVADAAREGRPYHAVVLAASSYDGVLYNLHRIMSECLAVSPSTAFLVDEAWSAINAFHPSLRPLTALDAADRITADGTPITLLVTQSAHKSMSAARQGSYLHVIGDAPMISRVARTLYSQHTTSPSIPILASLDLARAHAQRDGQRLVQRALDLAADARSVIAHDPDLSDYRVRTEPILDATYKRYLAADPTKVLIDVSQLGLTGEQVRLRLFHDYGVYVSRTLEHGFLVNFHIGIVSADVERLLGALRSLARRTHGRRSAPSVMPGPADGSLVDCLLIAYPPGVPLAVPGERWTAALHRRVESSRRDGAEVYLLPTRRRQHGELDAHENAC